MDRPLPEEGRGVPVAALHREADGPGGQDDHVQRPEGQPFKGGVHGGHPFPGLGLEGVDVPGGDGLSLLQLVAQGRPRAAAVVVVQGNQVPLHRRGQPRHPQARFASMGHALPLGGGAGPGRGRGDGALIVRPEAGQIILPIEVLQGDVGLLPVQQELVQGDVLLGGVVADEGVPRLDGLALADQDLQGDLVLVPVDDHAGAGGDAAAQIRLVGGILQQPIPHGLDLAGLAQGVAAVAVDAPRHQTGDEQEDQQDSQQRFHRPASSRRYPS